MVSREQLRERGLRAYELGRLRRAARVGLIVVPMAALCLGEGECREVCALVAAGLLGLCVWLRWHSRRGFDAVTWGLQAGLLPLGLGLLLELCNLRCGWAGADFACTLFAVVVGGASGLYIGTRGGNGERSRWSIAVAGGISVLAAVLGCARLGLLGTTSTGIGIVLGMLVSTHLHARQQA